MTSLERMNAEHAVRRLLSRDPSLWSDDPEVQARISDRLGWTDVGSCSLPAEGRARELARELVADDIADVVLLGMGGSSLAALTLASVFDPIVSGPRIHVVDTTSPTTVSRLMRDLDPATTAFFVSSKSGGTIEPNTLYVIFRAWADAELGDSAGRHFVAITDPGSSLEALAETDGFRATLLAPPDVGGRFSALTIFGLAPAACAGIDLEALLGRGAEAQRRCALQSPDNPAVQLAAFIADGHASGRDKLTMVTSPGLETFALWAEQLIAESTGKEGVGVIPVPELSPRTPTGYGDDRSVVVLRFAEDAQLAAWVPDERTRRPVFEIVFEDRYDLSSEFVRWEHATALVGFLLGINPFDEPNVAEAKAATLDVLEGRAEAPCPTLEADGVRMTFSEGVRSRDVATVPEAFEAALARLGKGGYFALLTYLPDDPTLISPLRASVPPVAATTGHATVLELGPRYLHSTGQLHKGGPETGVFVVITARDEPRIEVPGQSWTLADLIRSQAAGDFLTLAKHRRPVVWIELPDASPERVTQLAEALAEDALG
ncbi:MAG: glucose-6-phosphate isomerase [Coriobacteriales bacterium]|nr:glucose-6-phosphate isomerase [Coriobacteriales bacterium]